MKTMSSAGKYELRKGSVRVMTLGMLGVASSACRQQSREQWAAQSAWSFDLERYPQRTTWQVNDQPPAALCHTAWDLEREKARAYGSRPDVKRVHHEGTPALDLVPATVLERTPQVLVYRSRSYGRSAQLGCQAGMAAGKRPLCGQRKRLTVRGDNADGFPGDGGGAALAPRERHLDDQPIGAGVGGSVGGVEDNLRSGPALAHEVRSNPFDRRERRLWALPCARSNPCPLRHGLEALRVFR